VSWRRRSMAVAAAAPRTAPPTGEDWIPVALDGRWWWDGARWTSTVQSPWPAQAPLVVVAPGAPRRRLLARALLLPFRLAGLLLRPVAGIALGLLSVALFFVLLAVVVAHLAH
jgi:hypothetical protein